MRQSNIYKNDRGYYYYQTWTYLGTNGTKRKQIQKYLGKKTPSELKILKREWDNYYNEIDQLGVVNKNPFKSPPRPVSQCVYFYHEYEKGRYESKEISKTTLNFQVENTKRFRNYVVDNLGDLLIDRVTTKTIEDYKNYRQDLGLKPNTISINLRTLRGFFNWCIEQKYIHNSPVENVKIPKYKSRPSEEIPMGEDWERLYDFCKKSLTFVPPKVYAPNKKGYNQHIRSNKWDWWNRNTWFKYMIYIMINTGMRGGEVRILKWERGKDDTPDQPQSYSHLSRDMKKLCIYFKGGYGEIPLTDDLKDMFKKLKRHSGDNVYVFQNPTTQSYYQKRYFYDNFRRLCIGLGLVDKLQHPLYKPHSIRHGVVSRLISQGVDMFKIQKLLRHSSIRTTLDIYGHLKQDDLTETMNLLR